MKEENRTLPVTPLDPQFIIIIIITLDYRSYIFYIFFHAPFKEILTQNVNTEQDAAGISEYNITVLKSNPSHVMYLAGILEGMLVYYS